MKTRFTVPAGVLMPGLAIAGASLLLGCTRPEAGEPGTYRGAEILQPRPKVDFTLTDTEGQPFDFRAETEGYVTLLFFGYTHCPDVCPVHMANLGAVMGDYPTDLRRQFKVVFVTTDPDRDTPERLREWLDNFDRDFIGLRGTHEEVNQIERAVGLPASVKPQDHGKDYQVGHAASVVAYTKDNLAHLMYPFGTRQADWAHDLPRLARETWR